MARNIAIGRAYVAIGAENAPLYKALSKAERRIDRFGAKVGKVAQGLAAFSTAILTPFALAGRELAGFSQQVARVGTVLSDRSRLGEFEQEIRDVAKAYGLTTEEVANSAFNLLSAQVPVNEALKGIAASAELAAGGFADANDATDALLTTFQTFRGEVTSLADASDFLSAVAQQGRTDLARLAPQVGRVASTAKNAGLTVEEFGASISTLTRATGRTDLAITQLQALVSALSKVGDEGKKIAREKFNLEITGENVKAEGFFNAISKLRGATQDELTKIFGNIRAVAGVTNLLAKYEGAVKDVTVLQERAGISTKNFELRQKSFGFQVTEIVNKVNDLALAVGKKVQPVLEEWFDTIDDGFAKVSKFVDENGELIQVVFKVGAAAAAAAISLGALAIAAKGAAIAVGVSSGLAKAVGFTVSAFKSLQSLAFVASLTSIKTPVLAVAAAFKGLTVQVVLFKVAALKAKAALAVGLAAPLAALVVTIGAVAFAYNRMLNFIRDTEAIRQAENAILNLQGRIRNLNKEIQRLNEEEGLGFNYTAEQATADVDARIRRLLQAGKTAQQINDQFAKDIDYLRRLEAERWNEANALSKENFEANAAERRKQIAAFEDALRTNKAMTIKAEKEKAVEVKKIFEGNLDAAEKLYDEFLKKQNARAVSLQQSASDEAFAGRLKDDPQAEAGRLLQEISNAELELLVAKADAEDAISRLRTSSSEDDQQIAKDAVKGYEDQAAALDELNAKRREALQAVGDLLREEGAALEERTQAVVAFRAQVQASFDKNEFISDAKSQFDGLNKEAQRFIKGAEKQVQELQDKLISGAISQGVFDEQLAALQGRLGDALAARSDKQAKAGGFEQGTFGTFSAREAAGRLGKTAIKVAEQQLEVLKTISRGVNKRSNNVAVYPA